MSEELKPCPFCVNSKPEVYHECNSNKELYRVKCRKCGIQTHLESKDRVIAIWNRRVEPIGNSEELTNKTILKHCLHEKDCANYGLYDSCIREFNTPICCCHFKATPDELPGWVKEKLRARLRDLREYYDHESSESTYYLIHEIKSVLSLRRDE